MKNSIEKSSEKTEILLVDDSPANLLSLEALLETEDLSFIRALSGEEALEAALKSRPALVLLDVQMPGMDGFEVARLLRSTERTRQIPIIFVTATHREEKFTFQGFENGAVDYLFKPLNPTILKSKVKVFVELYQNRILLERAVRDLTLMNQELESFSFSVSHDLRAPIRRISGFVNIVQNELGGSEHKENLELLDRAQACCTQMNGLVDGLLELARVSRCELKKDTVNLSKLAQRICDDFKNDPSVVVPELRVSETETVLGDERLLENVMRNLLGNAWKFTSKTEKPQIEFGMKKASDRTVFYVQDNGAGFNMESARRLFGAFQRFHAESDFKGTGVGLATVQRIIHRHGGRIWAESEPQKQTTFFFTLWDEH